jgi:hypothetical protein
MHDKGNSIIALGAANDRASIQEVRAKEQEVTVPVFASPGVVYRRNRIRDIVFG